MKKKYLAAPYAVWMVLFTAVPLVLIAVYAFTDTTSTGQMIFTTEHIIKAFNANNMSVLLRSIEYAVITTVICLVLGYPIAMMLSNMSSRWAGTLAILFVLPMWMNFLLRTYAWRTLLDPTGPIMGFLRAIGMEAPQVLYTEGAVILGLVYNFLPFMILPIYSVFVKMNKSYLEAAEDLGANKIQSFLKVTLPLTRPGIITGITMVFMPAISTFVISRLLGGSHYMMYGDVIENQFMLMSDWNMGSALSVIMLVLMMISMAIMRKYDKDEGSAALW